MLSVLFPVYNWDISQLAKEIHSQCVAQSIAFEIIAVDDCSPNTEIKNTNSKIHLDHFRWIELTENVGNAEARNILARTAKNDWLLFMDADMMPAADDFIQHYLHEIQMNDFDIMSGGILYELEVSSDYKLKWLHGTKTEQQIENKNPYLEIRGNNFLVRKEIFLQNPLGGLPENYGYVDTHFGLKLKQAKARVKIIDNPAIHLGLETNQRFVEKFKTALRNAYWMMNNQPEMADNLKIIKVYKKINRLKLRKPIAVFYRMFEKQMLGNLHSKNPSLFVFQVFKLAYFCDFAEK